LRCRPDPAKRAAARVVHSPAARYPAPRHACAQVRVVRIFNTYGPRMALDDGRVVSNFVAQALTGQPMTIYGDGQQTRSFQYVSDLIEGARPRQSAVPVPLLRVGRAGRSPGAWLRRRLAHKSPQNQPPLYTPMLGAWAVHWWCASASTQRS